jgi:pimeloyl-ACP methyl ester carboxylesterase/protein-S-isoprenylcysteine O-methyltransferase Ste14
MSYLKTAIISIGTALGSYIAIFLTSFLDVSLGLPDFVSKFSLALGLLILLTGFFFRLWASHTFHKNKIAVLAINSQSKLIKTGPYAFTRSPHYIGITSIVLGWSLIMGSIIGIALAFLHAFAFHYFLVSYEEKRLKQRFGRDYSTYKKAVPRWIDLRKGKVWMVILFSIALTTLIPLAQLNCPATEVNMPISDHTIKVDGLNTHYRTVGDPGKQPLVYVAGMPMNHIRLCSTSADPVLAEFAKHFYVITPDNPGFRQSDLPPEFWAFEEYADHLNLFLRQLDINNPIVLGKSFGGGIAATYAKRYPENTKVLILVDSVTEKIAGYPITDPGRRYLPPLIKFTESSLTPLSIKRYMIGELLDVRREEITYANFKGYLLVPEMMLYIEFNVDPEQLEPPLVMVWGNEDKITPVEKAKKLHEIMPDSKLLIFDGGHLVMEKNPEKVVSEILKNLPQ